MNYFQDWHIEQGRTLSLHGALTERIEVYSGTAWITYAHESRDFFLTRDHCMRLERDNMHVVVESLHREPLHIRTHMRETVSLPRIVHTFAAAANVTLRRVRRSVAHGLSTLAKAIEPVCSDARAPHAH